MSRKLSVVVNGVAALVGAGALVFFAMPTVSQLRALQPSEIVGERLAERHAVIHGLKGATDAGPCGLARDVDETKVWNDAIIVSREALGLPAVAQDEVDEADVVARLNELGCIADDGGKE